MHSDQSDDQQPTTRRHGGTLTSPDAIVAWLDAAGVIVAVNPAWERFCQDNGRDLSRAGVGVSYLAACDAAGDEPGAAEVAAAIRATLAGALAGPVTVRIACDSPTESRWFDVLIGPVPDGSSNEAPAPASPWWRSARTPRASRHFQDGRGWSSSGWSSG